jgi:hypothetical protein
MPARSHRRGGRRMIPSARVPTTAGCPAKDSQARTGLPAANGSRSRSSDRPRDLTLGRLRIVFLRQNGNSDPEGKHASPDARAPRIRIFAFVGLALPRYALPSAAHLCHHDLTPFHRPDSLGYLEPALAGSPITRFLIPTARGRLRELLAIRYFLNPRSIGQPSGTCYNFGSDLVVLPDSGLDGGSVSVRH